MFAGVFLASKMATWFPAATLAGAHPLLVVGLILARSGVAFHLWAVRTLGRHFRTIVIIQQGHELVSTGPYRYLSIHRIPELW